MARVKAPFLHSRSGGSGISLSQQLRVHKHKLRHIHLPWVMCQGTSYRTVDEFFFEKWLPENGLLVSASGHHAPSSLSGTISYNCKPRHGKQQLFLCSCLPPRSRLGEPASSRAARSGLERTACSGGAEEVPRLAKWGTTNEVPLWPRWWRREPERRAEIEPRERTCGLRRGSRGEARGRADRD